MRISHWVVAACVFVNILELFETGETLHRYIGYTAATVVLLRLLWGFVGSRHARFSDFWPTPSRLQSHWQNLRQRQADTHPGHNPLGALMMLAMWTVILGLALSGYLMGTDRFFGEEWLEELHETMANGLILLVCAHVVAVVLMSLYTRVNLARAMITGRKKMPH